MHMQSRSVDLDLPRARGALPRDPGLPYALALPVGVACRGCVCVCVATCVALPADDTRADLPN